MYNPVSPRSKATDRPYLHPKPREAVSKRKDTKRAFLRDTAQEQAEDRPDDCQSLTMCYCWFPAGEFRQELPFIPPTTL